MRAQLIVGGYLAKVPRLTPAKVVALLAAMLGAVVALGLAAPAASAETFSNNSPITINNGTCSSGQATTTTAGKASPYPSTITVTNSDFPEGSRITDVNVTVSGLSHVKADDIGLLLVSPEGPDQKSVILMTDSGGFGLVSGINLTFDDADSGPLPDNALLVSGTYLPSRGTVPIIINCGAPASFPEPAPAGPYGSTLSVFNDTNPNGTWTLYVIDDSNLDSGSISGGWSLDISAVPRTKDACKKGGWKAFGYPDQGRCITFVNENRS
jgi:subtilisin-like proprotein convertase family protein